MNHKDNKISTVEIGRNTVWAMLDAYLPKLVMPLITILLAYFLSPEDYGIVAIPTLVVTLILVFQQQGVGDALIQHRNDSESARNVTYWFSVSMGLCFSVIVFALAPLIAKFYHNDKLILVMQIQAWQILIASLGSTHVAILRKEIRFKKLTGINIVPGLCPLLIALPLASAGYGYWSLIVSTMAAESIRVVMLYIFIPWRPSRKIDIVTLKKILWFSSMVSIEALSSWFFSQGDYMILGYFTDMITLGLYSYGYKIVLIVISLVIAPFTSHVIFSTYCRQADNPEQLVRTVKLMMKYIAFFLLPVCFGMAAVSHKFIPLIFDQKWHGLSEVIIILSISPGIFSIFSPLNSALKASGRPDVLVLLQLATIVLTVIILSIAAKYGLIAFCWGRFSIPIIFLFPRLIVTAKYLKTSAGELLKPTLPFLIISAGMFILVRAYCALEINFFTPMISAGIAIVIGAIFYAAAVHFYNKALIPEFIALAANVFGKRTRCDNINMK